MVLLILTISAMSGSSGLGSAINNCILVNTVLIFKHGFHAPCNQYIHLLQLYWLNTNFSTSFKISQMRGHCGRMLDSQLPVQSVPISTKVVSSNPVHYEVYSIQHYVIKFVSDLWQVVRFLQVHHQ